MITRPFLMPVAFLLLLIAAFVPDLTLRLWLQAGSLPFLLRYWRGSAHQLAPAIKYPLMLLIAGLLPLYFLEARCLESADGGVQVPYWVCYVLDAYFHLFLYDVIPLAFLFFYLAIWLAPIRKRPVVWALIGGVIIILLYCTGIYRTYEHGQFVEIVLLPLMLICITGAFLKSFNPGLLLMLVATAAWIYAVFWLPYQLFPGACGLEPSPLRTWLFDNRLWLVFALLWIVCITSARYFKVVAPAEVHPSP